MAQFARLLFILLLLVGTILIAATVDLLPQPIATHFGAQGGPNGWMDRGGYLWFMLAFAIGIPITVVLTMAVLPRWTPRAINLPHREYWLAPARRESTLRYLETHAYWLGSLLVVFIATIHLLLIQANSTYPPTLPLQPLVLLMVSFLIGLAIWATTLTLRFRRRT